MMGLRLTGYLTSDKSAKQVRVSGERGERSKHFGAAAGKRGPYEEGI
jgi:hypothetical protein